MDSSLMGEANAVDGTASTMASMSTQEAEDLAEEDVIIPEDHHTPSHVSIDRGTTIRVLTAHELVLL